MMFSSGHAEYLGRHLAERGVASRADVGRADHVG